MSKSLLGFLLKWFITLALLTSCALLLDLEKIAGAISKIGLVDFAIAVLLALVGTVILPAVLTRKALFKDQIRVNQLELVIINLCMRFYTLVLPRALSIAIRWQRYRARGGGANATALMVFERVVQILVYCLAAFLFLALDTHPSETARTSFWALSILGLTSLIALVIFLTRGKEPANDNARLEGKGWAGKLMLRLWEAVRAYRDLSYPELLQILFLSILTYLLFVTAAYVVADSMNLPITWGQLAWIRTIVFLLTLIPITIGGMGVRELGFAGILGLYGVDPASAFTLGLSLSAAQIVIAIVGALFELRYWLDRNNSKTTKHV
jgi:uncharacterized membrane protein YbhN (UPF0104 family)